MYMYIYIYIDVHIYIQREIMYTYFNPVLDSVFSEIINFDMGVSTLYV